MSDVNESAAQEVHCIEDLDAATDYELKHTPNVEVEELASGQLIKATIGLKGIEHPQTEEHLIEWIRCYVDGKLVGEEFFTAAETPVAAFEIKRTNEHVAVQAFCNLHGIWEAGI